MTSYFDRETYLNPDHWPWPPKSRNLPTFTADGQGHPVDLRDLTPPQYSTGNEELLPYLRQYISQQALVPFFDGQGPQKILSIGIAKLDPNYNPHIALEYLVDNLAPQILAHLTTLDVITRGLSSKYWSESIASLRHTVQDYLTSSRYVVGNKHARLLGLPFFEVPWMDDIWLLSGPVADLHQMTLEETSIALIVRFPVFEVPVLKIKIETGTKGDERMLRELKLARVLEK